QQTQMPPLGSEARAQQLGTVGRLAHEAFVSDEIGALLEELRPYAESLDQESFEASLVRVVQRDYDKSVRVPPDLSAEITRADSLDGLFAMMHECGHGLYENGVDPSLERTPLARGASLGLHESQSRLWENLVGRSRPFWSWFYPRVQETFPSELGDVDEETWFRS